MTKAVAVAMPKTVLIGSVTYDVTTDSNDWMRIEHALSRKGSYGYTVCLSACIYINPESSPDQQRLTLWHEVMHALCETVMGAPDWDDLGEDQDDREERVIRNFESPIVMVLRDNPKLVAYLTD